MRPRKFQHLIFSGLEILKKISVFCCPQTFFFAKLFFFLHLHTVFLSVFIQKKKKKKIREVLYSQLDMKGGGRNNRCWNKIWSLIKVMIFNYEAILWCRNHGCKCLTIRWSSVNLHQSLSFPSPCYSWQTLIMHSILHFIYLQCLCVPLDKHSTSWISCSCIPFPVMTVAEYLQADHERNVPCFIVLRCPYCGYLTWRQAFWHAVP